ncbi:MAG: aspartate aminotransferase family protein [Nitritalea sp.]
MKNIDYHHIDQQHHLRTFNRIPITFVKGRGARLWDAEGREYLDMLAGIAVTNVGHCHPKVVKALQEQAAELMHISNFFVSPPQVALSKLLTHLSGLERVFFTNSGAESVEGAVKIARRYAHAKGRGGEIISFEGAFHGRTLATIASGQKKYQEGFAPIPGGFRQVPFSDFEAVASAVSQETAAVLVEPIQGEGGVRPVCPHFLKKLRKLCDEQDIVLIFDEIQCGIGRTGHWFAKDYYEVQPDMMTLAKGLGGGIPIGAFLTNDKVAAAVQFGDHGTTFGGNPLATATALATLQVIQEEKLLAHTQEMGQLLREEIKNIQADFPEIEEIRGKGLMLGIVFKQETLPIMRALLKERVVANATAGNVLRLVPPLTISEEEIFRFSLRLRKVLQTLQLSSQQALQHDSK